MPNFTKGRNFTSTEELTNTKLHTLIEDAAIGVTAITSLTALTDPVGDTDTLPIADDSATAIRKVAASNFLKKNASAVFDAGTTKITGVDTPTVGSDAATKTYADTKVAKTGDTLSGSIDMGSNKITSLGTPTVGTDAATKTYADTKVSKSGDTMSGVLDMGSSKITNLGTPTASGDATTKAYVDSIAVVAGNLPIVTSGNNGSLLKVTSGVWTTTATDAVSTALIQDASVTGAKLENSGATAGTYGSATAIPQITIDAKGRITSALSFNATPADNTVSTVKIVDSAVTTAKIADSGVTTAKMADLSPSPAGTVGSSTLIPILNVNAKGQITSYTTASAAAGATGGGTDKIFWENDQTVTTNYTLTASKNALSAGAITINAGVTVTVPTGGVWTVV